MLILCDFDGTITTQDVTNFLLDHFTGPGWREEVLPAYWAGKLNHYQLMQVLYATLQPEETELLAVSKEIKFRANFERFVAYCKEKKYSLSVVSGGLDFYIRAFLPDDLDIPFYSYRAEYDRTGGNWQVHLPDWPPVNLDNGEDFKVRVLEELKRQHPQDHPVVFIGDGRNDGPVARVADLVFAVRNTKLVEICTARGQVCIEFDDFAEVITALEEFARNKSGVE
ncbi:MAG: putative 27 [Chloroflexi bacterium]|nr:putative 27 [Chloroflexota bacterium]